VLVVSVVMDANCAKRVVEVEFAVVKFVALSVVAVAFVKLEVALLIPLVMVIELNVGFPVVWRLVSCAVPAVSAV